MKTTETSLTLPTPEPPGQTTSSSSTPSSNKRQNSHPPENESNKKQKTDPKTDRLQSVAGSPTKPNPIRRTDSDSDHSSKSQEPKSTDQDPKSTRDSRTTSEREKDKSRDSSRQSHLKASESRDVPSSRSHRDVAKESSGKDQLNDRPTDRTSFRDKETTRDSAHSRSQSSVDSRSISKETEKPKEAQIQARTRSEKDIQSTLPSPTSPSKHFPTALQTRSSQISMDSRNNESRAQKTHSITQSSPMDIEPPALAVPQRQRVPDAIRKLVCELLQPSSYQHLGTSIFRIDLMPGLQFGPFSGIMDLTNLFY